ncbi:CHAT domain-containing protein [Alkalinema pantanalense CENA528]|uniref:CHAT domain-containing protein n=1 Tax=Alkalinema pantanalense TaxID=1620705 RepID=UPI003D701029
MTGQASRAILSLEIPADFPLPAAMNRSSLFRRCAFALSSTLILHSAFSHVPILAAPAPRPATTAAQRQPLSIYQPLHTIPWEGFYFTKIGVAYFATEPLKTNFIQRPELDELSAPTLTAQPLPVHKMLDSRKTGWELVNYAIAAGLDNQFDRAINAYKRSLQIAKEIGDHELEGLALGGMGLLRAQQGFYDVDTIDYLTDYWRWTREQQNPKAEAIALSNLGNAYFASDLYLKAIEFHQKRLALARKLGDRNGVGRALGNLGMVQQALGNFDKALALHQQQWEIVRQGQDIVGQKMALANLGIAAHGLEDYAKAIDYQTQRLKLAQQTQDPRTEAEALANIAGAQYFLGNYDRAIELYEQAWAIAWNKLQDADILYGLRGNEGLAYFQKGDYAKAMELYQQYFRYISSRNNRRGEGLVKNNVGVLRMQDGNLTNAEKTLRDGIQLWDTLRDRLGNQDAFKISLFDTQTVPYVNLQSLLVQKNQIGAALEVSEQGRSRAFAELLQRRSQPLKQKMTDNPPNLERIKQIAKQNNATLVQYSMLAEIHKSKAQGNDPALKNQESELLIWVIKPTGEVFLRKSQFLASPNWQQQAHSLSDLVADSRSAIGVRGRGIRVVAKQITPENDPPLQQLHRLLIQPIADLLPQKPDDLVVLLPQQSLFLVPFAALQDKDGTYLIEKHTIVTAPSIQVFDLAQQQRQQLPKRSLFSQPLIVGNPQMPTLPMTTDETPEILESLPGAETEAKSIGQLLQTQPLLGAQATEPTVIQQMTNASLIHLATHGLLDDFQSSGFPGAIALAPTNTADGFLTADELLNLKLQAELVVLSACNTGRGRITGDGVVGLSRSLFAAGVPTVLASLWAVPDAPTSTLMTAFYETLKTEPNKARALRKAMLQAKQQHPDPKDWASFVLVGTP